jgi:flagellar hook-length control protein FliK
MSLLNNLENPEPSPLNNRITPVNPLEIKPGWESKLLKFSQSQLREIFSPQNFLFDRQSIETVKTKEGDLNLLTGEENFIFTFLKGVNSDLWSINRPVSLPKLPLIIFSVLQEIPFKAEKTIIILHLTPENLGSLVIKVTKQEDKLTILFCTTNHNVKEIIEASFPQLKEALFQQNLLLDKAMVLITNQEEGRGQNNYSEGRWQTGQPYTSQKVKTKEVSLSLLTGEENFMPKATTINYWV